MQKLQEPYCIVVYVVGPKMTKQEKVFDEGMLEKEGGLSRVHGSKTVTGRKASLLD